MGESMEAEGGFGQCLASRSRAFAAVEVLADFGHDLDAPPTSGMCVYECLFIQYARAKVGTPSLSQVHRAWR